MCFLSYFVGRECRLSFPTFPTDLVGNGMRERADPVGSALSLPTGSVVPEVNDGQIVNVHHFSEVLSDPEPKRVPAGVGIFDAQQSSLPVLPEVGVGDDPPALHDPRILPLAVLTLRPVGHQGGSVVHQGRRQDRQHFVEVADLPVLAGDEQAGDAGALDPDLRAVQSAVHGFDRGGRVAGAIVTTTDDSDSEHLTLPVGQGVSPARHEYLTS